MVMVVAVTAEAEMEADVIMGHGRGCDGGNNYCDHHDCHEHHHHSSTHFSDSHHGDVTVEMNAKLEYVDLIIGDVHDEVLDLSDKPSEIRVDNLDIDGGDTSRSMFGQ